MLIRTDITDINHHKRKIVTDIDDSESKIVTDTDIDVKSKIVIGIGVMIMKVRLS
jgi:hypothetical protein